MAILYVASEEFELAGFASHLVNLRRLKWPIHYAYEGVLEGRRMLLACHGSGPRLASQAVEIAIRATTFAELSSSRLEAVVATGFCGALDQSLRECQIIVAVSLLDLASNETFTSIPVETTRTDFVSGVIATQDRIAIDASEKKRLHALGPIAVDMEAAAVAARAQRASLPFFCVKVISDRADEFFGFNLNRMRSAAGRIQRGKIVVAALTHPALVPELFRWRRRSRNAARALGEFLVDCRIKPPAEAAGSGSRES